MTSVIPGADGQRVIVLEDGDDNGEGDRAALDFMTVSAADLNDMESVRVASMKVRTAEERAKFSEMWATYTNTVGRWDNMAVAWKCEVYAILKGGKECL